MLFLCECCGKKARKNTPETNPYMKKFLLKTSWVPQKLAVFAGKIDYPKYNFIDKQMIRFIMWITKGPTNIKIPMNLLIGTKLILLLKS